MISFEIEGRIYRYKIINNKVIWRINNDQILGIGPQINIYVYFYLHIYFYFIYIYCWHLSPVINGIKDHLTNNKVILMIIKVQKLAI